MNESDELGLLRYEIAQLKAMYVTHDLLLRALQQRLAELDVDVQTISMYQSEGWHI